MCIRDRQYAKSARKGGAKTAQKAAENTRKAAKKTAEETKKAIAVSYTHLDVYKRQVKTNVAFNLTKRQIVCFAVALLLGLPLFFLLKDLSLIHI